MGRRKTRSMKKAVILISGGMDSCITASIAKKNGFELCFMHINYGQKTEKKELESFNKIARFFKIKEKLIIDCLNLQIQVVFHNQYHYFLRNPNY